MRFKATNANTTTSTLNVNGLGVKSLKKLDGATNLAAGDIKAGRLVEAEYDGTYFQMLSPSGTAPLGLGSIGLHGDGSDGAPDWSAGATLNPATEKRYTTATLSDSQTLSLSSSNTTLVLHSTGDVTLNGKLGDRPAGPDGAGRPAPRPTMPRGECPGDFFRAAKPI